MPNYSHATVAGHIVRDPETKEIREGLTVTNFTVAVNDRREKADTLFLDCAAWNKQGEVIAEYHRKGDPILVSGELKQENWEAKDGSGKRSKVKMDVRDFAFVKPKDDSTTPGTGGGQGGSGGPNKDDASPSKPRGAAAGGYDPNEIPF